MPPDPPEPADFSQPLTGVGGSGAGNFTLVMLGTLLTLAIYGYRFGEGNHTIYLLDGLRQTQAGVLDSDWFATQTLQYHATYGLLVRTLMRWNILEPAFAALYLILVVAFHVSWMSIAMRLSGDRRVYLLSLALYYALAAGTGLGFYQFFQDSSFLPSNVANVALLWGIWLWIVGRPGGAGACFGVAGLFHLNHAVVAVGLWIILSAREGWCAPPALRRPRQQQIFIGSLLAIVPAMVNIVLASQAKLARTGTMPLGDFVDLYVRLRHPHHYDPSTWPAWLWLAFLIPLPLAVLHMLRRHDPATQRARHVFGYFVALQAIALVGAGVWYVSETLVQMSLYRFSIYIQLLACIMSAAWVAHRIRGRWVTATAAAVCAGTAIVCLLRGPFFGAFAIPEDDAEYRELSLWARYNTPIDAVFLVPPGESGFRYRAQRAVVVNFKAVPQLSSELVAWRERLSDVLGLDDLRTLPRGYSRTFRAIDERYAALPDQQLVAAADKWQARFIVAPRPFASETGARMVFSTANQRYFLYDLMPEGGDR